MPNSPRIPVVLTIAGSDSGGGAGIQADLKTFEAFGVFGTCAVTAVTAQNTMGVRAVHTIPASLVQAQIEAVVSDLVPSAVKTGMLATQEVVEVVADTIQANDLSGYVLDPVMVATSGQRLLEGDAREMLTRKLLPLATLVTPNIPEAEALTGRKIDGTDGMREAARALVGFGAEAALLKGGHLGGDEAIDLLWDGSGERLWRRARIDTPHTHGTGCSLSAAVTAGLALGWSLPDSVDRAISHVARAIANAPGLGRGNGPIHHGVDVELPPRRE